MISYGIKATRLTPKEEKIFKGDSLCYCHVTYGFSNLGNYSIGCEERKILFNSIQELVVRAIDNGENLPQNLELILRKGDERLNKSVYELNVSPAILGAFDSLRIEKIGDIYEFI